MTTITNFSVGDVYSIDKTFALLSGEYLSVAWFTVKRNYRQETSALISKQITSILASGIGQITNITAAGMNFVLLSGETGLLNPYSEYPYDIQLRTNTGRITTAELGVIVAFPQLTVGG